MHFSSATDDWATPQDFYEELNEEFDFTLDVCASPANAKCDRYFTRGDDGLQRSWRGERCWMNPPYGREIKSWMKKAYDESRWRCPGCVPRSRSHGHRLVARLRSESR